MEMTKLADDNARLALTVAILLAQMLVQEDLKGHLLMITPKLYISQYLRGHSLRAIGRH